jgi:hypothetical protein
MLIICPLSFWRVRSAAINIPALAGVLQGKFPIDQLIQHGINIVSPTILIIQAVYLLLVCEV